MAIVNQAAAKNIWPNENPIGKRFTFFGEPQTLREIVGVVADTAVAQVGEDPPLGVVYLPIQQSYAPAVVLFAHTAADPAPVIPSVRNELQQMDHNLPLQNPQPIADVFQQDQGLWAARVGAGLLGLFGALAILLAAVGLYGRLACAWRSAPVRGRFCG